MIAPCPVCAELSVPAGASLGGFELFACPACTLRFAPRAFRVSVDYSAIYNTPEYVEEQVQFLKGNDPTRAKSHPTYSPFFTQLRPSPGRTLLDVGCGIGRFCQAAHVSGWEVTGIDISEQAIALGSTQARFPLLNCNLQDIIRSGRRFDVITAFEVIEHLSDPLQFLAAVRNALAVDGEFFATVPNWDSPEVQSAVRQDWVPPVHLCYYSAGALQSLARKAGLRSVTTGFIYSDPAPRHPVRLIRWTARRLLRPRYPLGLWLHARL
jgi:SAM-dependent methyltransferase